MYDKDTATIVLENRFGEICLVNDSAVPRFPTKSELESIVSVTLGTGRQLRTGIRVFHIKADVDVRILVPGNPAEWFSSLRLKKFVLPNMALFAPLQEVGVIS